MRPIGAPVPPGGCETFITTTTTSTSTSTTVAPINNPVELNKVNSGPASPGSTFDYTIAVGNIGTCTLTNVRVNDVLTGPAGTTIAATEPASASSPVAGGFTIDFPDIGPIAPRRTAHAPDQGAGAGSRRGRVEVQRRGHGGRRVWRLALHAHLFLA